MAKRMGANGRKKTARRRTGPRPPYGRLLAPALLCALVIISGTYLVRTQGGRVAALAEKMHRGGSGPVNKVVVEGSLHVNLDELVKRGLVALPKDLGEFKPERLQSLLKASPWIQKIERIRAAGGTVTLAVSERKPVALLYKRPVCLVDEEGVCLPLPPHTAYRLPLLSGLGDSTGQDGLRRVTAGDYRRMNGFLHDARSADTAFASAITQACFGPDRTVAVMLSGVPGVIVLDENEIPVGLERLASVLEGAQAGWTAPAKIDLSYRNIAFVTMHAAPRLAAAAAVPKKNKV